MCANGKVELWSSSVRAALIIFCLPDPPHSLKGHLGCKKCYYENILQQKKEAERQQADYEQYLGQQAV